MQVGVGWLLKKPVVISAKNKLVKGLVDRFNRTTKVTSGKVNARKSVVAQLAVAA